MDTLLIGIEGSDGVGKATQSALLKDWLELRDLSVANISFPRYNETKAGTKLWEFMKGPQAHTYNFSTLSPYEASKYYAEDRRDSLPFLRQVIATRDVVIFDRYVESNLIHQGGKLQNNGELDEFGQWIFNLEYKQHKLPRPHIIIYLDLPFSVASARVLARAKKRGEVPDTAESDSGYLRNSHSAGLFYAEKLGWPIISCVKPNGEELSREEIHNSLCSLLVRRFNL